MILFLPVQLDQQILKLPRSRTRSPFVHRCRYSCKEVINRTVAVKYSELFYRVLQRPRDVFWKIKGGVLSASLPGAREVCDLRGRQIQKEGGNSVVVLPRSRIAWEGLKLNKNNPRRARGG